MKNREEEIKSSNERVKEVKRKKSMFERLSESYREKEDSFLEERKKKLAIIRNIHKPIDEEEIKEHEQKFLELKRQKE